VAFFATPDAVPGAAAGGFEGAMKRQGGGCG